MVARNILFPRLDRARSSGARQRLLRSDNAGTAFDDASFEEALQDARAFPPTGGTRVSSGRLLELRQELREAAATVGPEREADAKFDIAIGRVLAGAGNDSRGDFGDPRVWDFLTLILVPELTAWRLRSSGPSQHESASAAKRITGGDRRHIFQKLWKRWRVFGPSVVESGRLTEDDYVATLERRITLERPGLARGVAGAILSSGHTGSGRREYTRIFMRNLQQVSGLVQIRDDDHEHVVAVVDHVHRLTLRSLT